jgi:uncharacterized protein involved in propanediol utilization
MAAIDDIRCLESANVSAHDTPDVVASTRANDRPAHAVKKRNEMKIQRLCAQLESFNATAIDDVTTDDSR